MTDVHIPPGPAPDTVLERLSDLGALKAATHHLAELAARAGRVADQRPAGWVSPAEIDTALERTIGWPATGRIPHTVSEYLGAWTPEVGKGVTELLDYHLSCAAKMDGRHLASYLQWPSVAIAVRVARAHLAQWLADWTEPNRARQLGQFDPDLWQWWLKRPEPADG